MSKKRFFSFFIALMIFTNLFIVPAAAAPVDPDSVYEAATVAKILNKTNLMDLKAKSAIILDAASGNVMFEKDSHEKLAIASVTKIMTMLLVMEAIDNGTLTLDTKVVASEHAYRMGGSQVYLKPGEEFTVWEMLKAVAIHSANDAAVALGEKIAGSEETFVSLMNDKARELGMKDTKFLDATGLTDDGHYSSTYDVAVMSRELIMKHPKILELTSKWQDTFRNGTFSLDNTNKLVRFYQGTNGLKTGFTNKAGFCLSASAKRNNLQLIAVVLGEPDSNTRFAEAKKLLDFGFSNFEVIKMADKGEVVGNIPVKKGTAVEVKGIFPDEVKLLLNKGEKSKVSREVKMVDNLTAPIKAGQKVGEAVYTVGDREVGRYDIVAESKVERASFIRLFFKMVVSWFSIGRS
ncbi:MAG: D-alanyl-D-alanine carboxypeptidase family protein [Bacillota bacterium]|nr:D-alanyl-D-alanine carboxypeptidase family protein [Bacillota bacterium]